MKYSILIKPNSNMPFVKEYHNMCVAELAIYGMSCGIELKIDGVHSMNKADVMSFEVKRPLTKEELVGLYQLSFFHMLFQVVEGGMFKPVVVDYQPDFQDDLSIRLKYNGKTNEQITRMMMMMAYHLSDFNHEKNVNLFDPLCGRGTTLFEGMISGFNAYGVERDRKAFTEMSTYITRYVKDARFKHNNKRGKVIHEGNQTGEFFELEYAKSKEDFRSKKLKCLRVFRGNTTEINGAFKQNMMHLIVADLPYNVQHKVRNSNEQSRGKGRNKNKAPKVQSTTNEGLAWLLSDGLKVWHPFLKKGGCVAVSWNIYTDKRSDFEKIFENQGYEVLKDYGLDQLEHRVAQAITRDIIIAKKI